MIDEKVNQYRILNKIGEGGMGEVYLAEDTILKRRVALKFMPLKSSSDNTLRERFFREAQAAAALNHPGIVTIHEINTVELDSGNQLFIAMEYIEGETLEATQKAAENQRLPVESVLSIGIGIAACLMHAHESGVIHRDIKPQNIILTKNGGIKILDFGLAALKGSDKLTGSISRIGTLFYMSPEQAQGDGMDHRTDIWSVGVVLYEMITGKLPFQGEHAAQVIHQIIEQPVPRISEWGTQIPEELEEIINKCLRKDQNQRFQTAGALLTALEQYPKQPTAVGKQWESQPYKAKDSERRHTTVMVVNISGGDGIHFCMEQEKASEILTACMRGIKSIAEKYDCGLCKQRDHGLICFFGIPTAIEQAPKAALNAAIEIKQWFFSWKNDFSPPLPLDLGIGINSGLVITDPDVDDEGEFRVTGDAVNLAVFFAGCAEDGQILSSSNSHPFSGNEFQFRSIKRVTPPGRKQPLTLFQLTSSEPQTLQRPFRREPFLVSQLVGREKELDLLKLQVMKVINGEGSIISIIGEAGIGKSRLVEELKSFQPMTKVRLLEGRAVWGGNGISYHPIIDIIKQWAHLREDEDQRQTLVRLENAVAETCPNSVDDVFPFVATLMGLKPEGKHRERLIGIEGDALSRMIQKSIRQLLMERSRVIPIVCIIHDIHWADRSSIDVVDSVLRQVEHSPILFIQVMRPNYIETGERLLKVVREKYRATSGEVVLKPLPNSECRTLMTNLAAPLKIPGSIMDSILYRAGGNPFFIEEVLHTFFDEGIMSVTNGKPAISSSIESIKIPDTIQEVIMARIDRLDEATRSLLKTAAVMGRFFFYKILKEVVQHPEELDSRLQYLIHLQLIVQQTQLNEIQYYFSHALAQEVIYQSILLSKRKALHLKIAQAVESVFHHRLRDFYGMLALHYSRGENLEKAEFYLIKAGEEALNAAASNEALNYYKEALDIFKKQYPHSADSEKIAELEKNIALALYNKGHYAEAVEYFDKVLTAWGIKRTYIKWMAAAEQGFNLSALLRFLRFGGRKNKPAPTLRENQIINIAQKRAAALSDVDVTRFLADSIGVLRRLVKLDISKVENGPAIFAASSGLFSYTGISFDISGRILDCARLYIDPNDAKTMLVYKYVEFIHHFHAGNWDHALEFNEDLINRNLEKGEFFFSSAFPEQYGYLYIEQGRFSQMEPLLNKLRDIGETYDSHMARGRVFLLESKRAIKLRKLTEASQLVEHAIRFTQMAGHSLFVLTAYGMKAYVRILSGDPQGAEDTLKHISSISNNEKQMAPNKKSYLLISRFLIALTGLRQAVCRGDETNRLKWKRKIQPIAAAAVNNVKKYAPDRTEVYKLMGSYYFLTRRHNRAEKWWNRSIESGIRLKALPELARTYLEISNHLMETGDDGITLNGKGSSYYKQLADDIMKKLEYPKDFSSSFFPMDFRESPTSPPPPNT